MSALSELLRQNSEEVVANWTGHMRALPESRYAALPDKILEDALRRWLAAILATLESGSFQAAEEMIQNIAHLKQLQGLSIQEALRAILLSLDAAFPLIISSFDPCSSEAAQAFLELNACVRQVAGQYGEWYAREMNRSLREQQRRTRLILEAAQASSRSLELDQVMEQVANGILSAINLSQCSISLVDSKKVVLVKSNQVSNPDQEPVEQPESASFTIPLEVNGQLIGKVILSVPHSRQAPDSPVLTSEEMRLAFDIVRAGALSIENARLYEETRRRLAESQSLQRVTAALLQKLSSNEVLHIVCREAMQLTGAAGSTVLLLEEDGWLHVAESAGSQTTAFERLPVDGSFTGLVVRTHAPQLTNHPESDANMYDGDIPLSALLAAPLNLQDTIIGVLDVVNKPDGFTEDDIRIISIFADQAAIAIENARLNQQVEHMAIIEERNRIARELHDSVTQSLYGVTLYAEAAGRLLNAGDNSGASDYLHDLRSTAQEALKEMRLLIYELRPPVLEKEGLAAALQARLDAVEGRAGLETELKVLGEGRMPASIEEGFYRIGQEALNNALKHAHAHKIQVALKYAEHAAIMEISDDGLGFDTEKASENSGFGLKGMQERANQFGGKLRITSNLRQGTQVHVEAAWTES